MFKLMLLKEFQRLKKEESNRYNLEWNIKRLLTKTNYSIHSDAIKEHILSISNRSIGNQWLIYAEEADILNVALFGCTAKEWRDSNKNHGKKGLNLRDFASINELVVLSNLENINALLIEKAMPKEVRFKELERIALKQMKLLNDENVIKAIRKKTTKLI